MVQIAARLGISALGLCDRNGLYGAVELIQAAKAAGIHPIIGTELELAGGSRIRLLARSRTGYRQLCRAVSASQLAGVKGSAAPGDRRDLDPAADTRVRSASTRAPNVAAAGASGSAAADGGTVPGGVAGIAVDDVACRERAGACRSG